MAEKRVFDEDHGISYPEIDITAEYLVTNRTRGPLQLTLRNESGTKMESLPLGARDHRYISGNRMTKYIFVLEHRKLLKVERLEPSR